MATQATDRLEVVDFMPAVEKLWNDRYRLTFYCRISDKKEDWFGDNVSTFLPAFGDLQGADFSGDGWSPLDGEEYDDMRLVEAGAPYISASGEHLVTLVYETLTDTFAQEVDDETNKPKNGLRGVTRKSVAKSGTEYTGEIGVTTIQHQINQETAITLYLAQVKIEDTDAYRRVTESWLEAGTLSETIDSVGSQKARVIETIGTDPITPTGYSLASKQESDFEGFQANRFTFLKNGVVLSESEDKVGSQLAITQEVFNGTPATPSGYSIASEQRSDVDGIPTKRYTFLKDNVVLSESEDKVGSQLTIVKEVFNGTPATPSGYSVASEQTSDVDGIATKRFTFLKDGTVLSESEDKVGSQLAVVQEVFNGTPATPSGYLLANTQESDVDGIPTRRYTFLKDDVELSRSSDFVGSQKAITIEVFNPAADPTEAGYSVARTEVSDVDGIPTKRFTFLEDNVVLSVSEDKVGSQKAVVNEVFNPTSETIAGIDTDGTALSGYSEANRTESDYEGIKTIRVQFLKPSILSIQQEFSNGLKQISVQAFGMTSNSVVLELSALAVMSVTDKLISQTESDYEGIKTSTFQYQVDEAFTEDYELNGLKRISIIELSATDFTAQSIGIVSVTAPTTGLYLGTQKIDNGGTIKIRESVWLEAGTLSETIDKVGSQGAKVIETIGADPSTPSGYSVAREEVSDVDGIPTKRFTFLKDNVVLSVSEDKVGSQKAVVNEVFNPTSETIAGIDTNGDALAGYSEANRTESDYEGIKTIRVTFLKPSILSVQQDFNNGLKGVSVQAFGMTATNVDNELAAITANHELISQAESDYEGIKTSSFQYQIDEAFTEDYELNGLKRISIIELSATDFTAQSIGIYSVTAPTNGLYLGTQEIDNGGTIKVRESVWLEAGILSISKTSESEGVMGVTTQFFGVEGTTVGPIISKDTGNYEGLPVISVKTLQDADGNSLVHNNENLVNSISGFSAFTYPGVIDVNYVSSSTSTNPALDDNVLNIQTLVKKAPAQTRVKTTVYFIFQSSSSITESDYTYASSDGLWSPNHWAGINVTGSGTGDNGEWNDSATFRGYRTSSTSSTATITSQLQVNALLKWQGDIVVNDTTSFTYTSTVDQGPPDPIGNKYTLDVQISPAFDDVGGTKYYKKVITVTDAIPTQPTTASLPYVETP